METSQRPPLDLAVHLGLQGVEVESVKVVETVVIDLKSGTVVWIGDGKGEKGLRPFLEALGSKGSRELRGVVSDLDYKGVVDTYVPKVIHILDRVHSVQWLIEALNQVRCRLLSAAPVDELGRTLKVKKWMPSITHSATDSPTGVQLQRARGQHRQAKTRTRHRCVEPRGECPYNGGFIGRPRACAAGGVEDYR